MIAVGMAVVFYVALSFQIFSYMEDDVFIFFRPAINLLHGHGLVTNNGERVEGWTSPLMLFWYALALETTSLDGAVWVTKAAGVLCGIAGIVLTAFLAHEMYDRRWWAAAGAAWLLASRAEYVASMLNSLETAFATILFLAGGRQVSNWTAANISPGATIACMDMVSFPRSIPIYALSTSSA